MIFKPGVILAAPTTAPVVVSIIVDVAPLMLEATRTTPFSTAVAPCGTNI